MCQRPKKKSFKSSQIYMKDAQCAELNEKSVFRFLWFYILNYGRFCSQFLMNNRPKLPKKKLLQKWIDLHERCAMCWNERIINFSIFVIFTLWDMVDYVLNSDFFSCFTLRFCVGVPDAFRLNPSSQLVFEHHWLMFLNQVYVSPINFFLFISGQIFRKDAQCSETDILVHELILCDF